VSSMVYKDNVLLIGDAAHSCWPSLGQGANVALETTHALRVTLEEMGDEDLPKALKTFDKLRKPQVDAAARLSQGGFGGSMNRTIGGVLMARMVFISILHAVLPTVFHRPALFEISNTAYSYDEVEKMMKRESFNFYASLAFGALTFWYLVFRNPAMRRSLGALVHRFVSAAIGAA
jgi:kynurenine 3-monooxygenase